MFVLSIIDQLYQRIVQRVVELPQNPDQIKKILKIDNQGVLPPSDMRKTIRVLAVKLKNSKSE